MTEQKKQKSAAQIEKEVKQRIEKKIKERNSDNLSKGLVLSLIKEA